MPNWPAVVDANPSQVSKRDMANIGRLSRGCADMVYHYLHPYIHFLTCCTVAAHCARTSIPVAVLYNDCFDVDPEHTQHPYPAVIMLTMMMMMLILLVW
jgi:hypothetical protein